jgi:hypothetical protein
LPPALSQLPAISAPLGTSAQTGPLSFLVGPSMSFRHYLETRYTAACEMQRTIHRDPQMIAMLRHGPPNPSLVQTWMREYGLFQGITAQDRNAVANRFLRFVAEHKRYGQGPNAYEIKTLYSTLFRALHDEVQRSWVSATSKLLWCLYPETIVIYDAFVHRALVVLQCIDDDLNAFPRIGGSPRVREDADITQAVQHYMNYSAMVHHLFLIHAPLLNDLRAQHNETYPYDIRILDKVLWMIGNSRESYPGRA